MTVNDQNGTTVRERAKGLPVELWGRVDRKVQQAARRHSDISKLWFRVYPSGLRPEDEAKIEQDDAGVI